MYGKEEEMKSKFRRALGVIPKLGDLLFRAA